MTVERCPVHWTGKLLVLAISFAVAPPAAAAVIRGIAAALGLLAAVAAARGSYVEEGALDA